MSYHSSNKPFLPLRQRGFAALNGSLLKLYSRPLPCQKVLLRRQVISGKMHDNEENMKKIITIGDRQMDAHQITEVEFYMNDLGGC
jgi:hypothetical protein